MQGITKVELEYQSDVVREETRILVEDIGLTDLENLQELTLHMNKGYLLADLCHYFQNSTTLTSLNLSNNNLQSSQCQEVLNSVKVSQLKHLDLSYNNMGREAARSLIDFVIVSGSVLEILKLNNTNICLK